MPGRRPEDDEGPVKPPCCTAALMPALAMTLWVLLTRPREVWAAAAGDLDTAGR